MDSILETKFFTVWVVRLWIRLRKEVVEHCSWGHQDVALSGVGFSGLGVTVAVLYAWLDMMVLKVSSNSDDSWIPLFKHPATECNI